MDKFHHQMLHQQHHDYLDEVTFIDGWGTSRHPYAKNSIHTLQCWQYKGITNSIGNQNTHVQRLEDGKTQSPEGDLKRWLMKDPLKAVSKPENAGELQGGFRLVLCDRNNMAPSMTMSRDSFQRIQDAFHLHSSTIPAFCQHGGAFAIFDTKDEHHKTTMIHVIIKVVQKVEITNCMLSLTHHVETGWTDAFICGDGVTIRPPEDYYPLREQLFVTLLSSASQWSNPLWIPLALLEICVYRMRHRTHVIEDRLVDVENMLGVTHAGMAGEDAKRPNWPEDIDVKFVTNALHSLLPITMFLSSYCHGLQRYTSFLSSITHRLSNDHSLKRHRSGFDEVKDTTAFLASTVDGMVSFFNLLTDRSNLQINLLFNVVSQQDGIINRRANEINLEIANSTKYDSISMSTFTFITAIFLPPTFIATLFSMSMFEWTYSDNGQTSTRTVSDDFWLYWAVTVPLTILTMVGWYVWFWKRNRDFNRRTELKKTSPPPIETTMYQPRRYRNAVGSSRSIDSYYVD